MGAFFDATHSAKYGNQELAWCAYFDNLLGPAPNNRAAPPQQQQPSQALSPAGVEQPMASLQQLCPGGAVPRPPPAIPVEEAPRPPVARPKINVAIRKDEEGKAIL